MWTQTLVAPGQFQRIDAPTLDEKDVPPGHVLLRTLSGGICGSDLPNFRGAVFDHPKDKRGYAARIPGFPMHEVVGEVVLTNHREHAVGDLVVGWASGMDAIAEYVVSDGEGLATYDKRLTPTTAVMIQPLACVLFAVEQIPDIDGAEVTVLGQGPIGLLFSHVLAHRGARVTGVDRADRSADAATFGVSEVVTSNADRWAASLVEGRRPHLVVEAVGHQISTLRVCVDAVAPGGQIFYFGIPDDATYPLEMLTFLRKNLTLRAGWTSDRRRVLAEADAYLAVHPELQKAYVSDVFAADDVQRAFETALVPKPRQFKIAIDMT
ncbi:zinc-binding dehydrogenase [Streptomyces sp. NPDC093544]|uniref:zinc-binding dehydrogenase n=1 Tax=Streptomyces sp. NPDC093544 TaxID=3155200 RepID=UPI003441E729